MTMYSIEPEKTLSTIREELVQQVAPALDSTTAINALNGIIEHLDNLSPRVDWDAETLGSVIADTENLAYQLGLDRTDDNPVNIETLRERRREISDVIRRAYESEKETSARVVAAVLEFSESDVPRQISVGLRPTIPEFE